MHIKLLQSLIILTLCRITDYTHVSWRTQHISLFLLRLLLYCEKWIRCWRVSQVMRWFLHQRSCHLTIYIHYLFRDRLLLVTASPHFDIIVAWNITGVAYLQYPMPVSILHRLIPFTHEMFIGMLKMKDIASRRIRMLLLWWCDMPFTGKLIDSEINRLVSSMIISGLNWLRIGISYRCVQFLDNLLLLVGVEEPFARL